MNKGYGIESHNLEATRRKVVVFIPIKIFCCNIIQGRL
jgi:hypothetical protein